MSVRVEFKARHTLVVIDGRITTDEIARVIASSMEDPRYDPKTNILLDNRPSLSVASSAEIQERVRLLGGSGSRFGNRIAILVSRSVHFGLGRMAEMLGEGKGLTIRVFEDEALALDWVTEGTESGSAL